MSNPLDRRFFSICKYCQGLIPVRWNQGESKYEYEAHFFKVIPYTAIPCYGSGARHDSSPAGDATTGSV